MDDLNCDELDPRIRNCVRWLRENGWNTTDSGDGSKAESMECAMDVPMVAIRLDDPATMASDANRLLERMMETVEYAGDTHRDLFRQRLRIEASYAPGEPAVILLTGESLLDWFS